MWKDRDRLAATARAQNFLKDFLEAYEHGIFSLKPGTKPHPRARQKNHLRGENPSGFNSGSSSAHFPTQTLDRAPFTQLSNGGYSGRTRGSK